MWNMYQWFAIFLVLKDSKDENNDKQKQDVGEKHSDQRQDNVPLRSREERKQNENSQIESEQRHDNVLLKDSNINEDIRDSDKEPGVQVVAPTENSMNKWANIIKVNFSLDTDMLNVSLESFVSIVKSPN